MKARRKFTLTEEGQLVHKMKLQCKEHFNVFKYKRTLEDAEELTKKLMILNNIERGKFLVAYNVACNFVQYFGNEHYFAPGDLEFRRKYGE